MKLENIVNQEFKIPYYLFEEIVDYVELSAKGENKTGKWNKIDSLIGLAVMNQRLTSEQANSLRNTYCRED